MSTFNRQSILRALLLAQVAGLLLIGPVSSHAAGTLDKIAKTGIISLGKVCTTTAEAALLLVDISDDDISRHF